MSENDEKKAQARPFPGHLAIWFADEEKRNPGWRDYVEEVYLRSPWDGEKLMPKKDKRRS